MAAAARDAICSKRTFDSSSSSLKFPLWRRHSKTAASQKISCTTSHTVSYATSQKFTVVVAQFRGFGSVLEHNLWDTLYVDHSREQTGLT